MTELVITIIGAILGLFGIAYGAKQHQRAKDADVRNEGLVKAYDELYEKQETTKEEVADVREEVRRTAKEREQAKTEPVHSDSVMSRLNRLRDGEN